MTVVKKYNTGIVLSGGGAKGFAHLGALKALEEYGIIPDVISGVSAGAIAGVFYADGFSTSEIFKIFTSRKLFRYFEITKPITGLMKISGLASILKDNLRAQIFEDLKMPLFVCAADLNNGNEVFFSSGPIIKPILASATIPILLQPIKINETLFVDGGLLNNLPVEPIYYDCERLIAIHVNPIGYQEGFNSLIKMAERCMHLSIANNVYHKTELFDLFIEPRNLISYGAFDFSKARKIFDIGYQAAIAALQKKKFKV
jgi:NTE family protein